MKQIAIIQLLEWAYRHELPKAERRGGGLGASTSSSWGMVYELGILGTVGFIAYFSTDPFFKGFYVPWQIPLVSLVAVALILMITGFIALRNVLRTEPAAVFR